LSFYDPIEVSASALTADRLNMDVIANNIANANTTRTPAGGAFKRQLVVLAQKAASPDEESDGEGNLNGVEAQGIIPDQSPDRLVYEPSHPDADNNGYVHMPNVEVVKEMVDLISASQAYQANVTAIQEARTMSAQTLNILQG
jgi:flagellar basal-body rod protein FlgC